MHLRCLIPSMSATVAVAVAPRLKYIRNDEGLFVCPTCGVTKENQNTMHYHMRKHAEKTPLSCRFCKKGFLQRTAMDLHIRSRHADELAAEELPKPDAAFSCPFPSCPFTSMTKGNLRTHCLRTHFQKESDLICLDDEETSSLQCVECEKFFKSKTSFYYHCHGCIDIDESDSRYAFYRAIA